MSPSLTDDRIASLVVALRRILDQHAAAGLPVEIIGWRALATSPSLGQARSQVTPAAAAAEKDAIRALAALDSAASLDRLHVATAHEPLLRHALTALAQTPRPDEDQLEAYLAVSLDTAPPPSSTDAPAVFKGRTDIWRQNDVGHLQPDAPDSDAHTPIDAALLGEILACLQPAMTPVELLYAEDDLLNSKAGWVSQTATLAEAVWATGIRIVEWPSASLLLEIDGERQDLLPLYHRSLDESDPPPPAHRHSERLAYYRNPLTALLDLGPLWIRVRTAKATFIDSKDLPAHRTIGLHGHALTTRIAVCAAAILTQDAEHRDGWQELAHRRIRRTLTRTGETLAARGLYTPPRKKSGGSDPLTLYSMRHDFIDRAKAAGLSAAEISALAGHSSPDTKSHYGRPKAGSRAAPRPVADPDETEAFARHHERRRAAKAVRRREARRPRASDSLPSPTPSM